MRLNDRTPTGYVASVALVAALLAGCGGGSGIPETAGDRARATTDAASTATTAARSREQRPQERSAEPRSAAAPKQRPAAPRAPSPKAAATPPSVTPHVWAGTADLQLVGGDTRTRTFKGPLAGGLPGEVKARLSLQGPTGSGTFVATLPGGTVGGSLRVVTSLGRGELRYTGSATTSRGTGRYASLTPSSIAVTGSSNRRGITMKFSGNLRY